jgi:hypothetical protein
MQTLAAAVQLLSKSSQQAERASFEAAHSIGEQRALVRFLGDQVKQQQNALFTDKDSLTARVAVLEAKEDHCEHCEQLDDIKDALRALQGQVTTLSSRRRSAQATPTASKTVELGEHAQVAIKEAEVSKERWTTARAVVALLSAGGIGAVISGYMAKVFTALRAWIAGSGN